MFRIYVLISTLFIFNSLNLFGQKTIISGKVIDGDTKEAVPYANISFQHSLIGTISKEDGTFYLASFTPTDTLVVLSVGYKVAKFRIKKGQSQVINVSLVTNSIALADVIVRPGENPAFKILKKINENKKHNDPSRLNSYQYKAYTKLRIDINNIDKKFKDSPLFKDFGFVFNYMDSSQVFGKNYLPILISETVSKLYYSKDPPIDREVIEAFKVSGIENKTISQYTGKMYQRLNIYDNFMTIFDPGFISPISDIGRLYYNYYLEDSSNIQGSWCHKIAFKPKRKQERTFYGYFWVADTSYAIKKYQLRVSADVNLNLLKDMIATVEYSKVNDTTWFVTSEDMTFDFNIGDKTYGLFGHKTADYDSIYIDRPLPDTLRKLHTDTYVLQNKLDRSDAYWNKNRLSPITPEEKNIYQMVDSVKKIPRYKTLYDITNMFVNYYLVLGPVELGPYYTTYSVNPVEGPRLRLGGRTSNKVSTKIMVGGHVAYGFKDDRLKYGLYYNYMFNTDPRIDMGSSYYHDIRQLGKSENAFLDDNYLTSILRRRPNYKLTMVDQFNTFFEREWVQGFSNILSFRYQTIYSTDYVPFRVINGTDTINKSYLTSAEFNLHTHFQYGEKFLLAKFDRISLGSIYPAFDLDLTYAPKNLFGSPYEYFKAKLMISDYIELNPFGYLKYRITAGKIFGSGLPYPLLKLHEGNETYAYDPLAFNMMNYYEFVSDEYINLWAEQHFQGFFFNRIPLLRALHFREVLSCNLLYGRLSSANKNGMIFPEGLTSLGKPYLEASAGIENILKLIRVDAVWRFSYLNHPDVSPFGIRVSLKFMF